MGFEQGFAEVETAAAAAERAAKSLAAAAKAMVRAAQEGDLGAIGRNAQKVQDAAQAAAREAANANSAWPFSPEGEEIFLREEYARELLAAAEAAGLKMQPRDGLLLCYPFIIRILPTERSVRINKTRFSGLRPSRLVTKLMADQGRKTRAAMQPFLEALYSAYQLVCNGDGQGGSVPLVRIYRAFTMLPGSAYDYSRDDFARDLFSLDRSGITETRSGARLSLPASTGTKAPANTFVCVAPDGEVVTYYAIRFSPGEATP
ncbi:MAG: hypothetical protein ACLQU2_20575 [Candidatus Binataceae bacterium]